MSNKADEQVIRFLCRPQQLDGLISMKRAYLRGIQEATPGAPHQPSARGSHPADPTAIKALRMAEVEEEIARLTAQRAQAAEQVRALLSRLPDPRMQMLLELRYLAGMTWERIAETLSLSTRSAFRCHRAALTTARLYLPLIASDTPATPPDD